MKFLAIILLVLVGTLALDGPIRSYADPQLDALLRIATQARENLSMNISQINNAPDEIAHLFKQGSDETDALSKAIDKQDIVSAKQHFLSAMKFFKTINDKINYLNSTQENDQQQADVLQLQNEITKIEKIGERLKTIAITNHANFDFTQFDQLIQKAKQDLDNGNIDNVSKSIEAANRLAIEAHHSLTTIAKQRITDRAKDFTEKQIERLDKIAETNTTKNIIPQSPKISSLAKSNSNLTSVENSKDMIIKLRKLVSEGNFDEALKVIKSLRSNVTDSSEQNNTVVKNETEPQVIPH
jgi:soluble cytochrome b562